MLPSYLPRLRGLRRFGAAVALLFVTAIALLARPGRETPPAPAPESGPTLDDIVKDLQKPLPAMHDMDPKIVMQLSQPVNLAGDEHQERIDRAFALIWFAGLMFAGWVMRGQILGFIAPVFAAAAPSPARSMKRELPAPEPPMPAPEPPPIIEHPVVEAEPVSASPQPVPSARTAQRATQFVRIYPVATSSPSKKPVAHADGRRHALATFVQVHVASDASPAPAHVPPRDGLTKEQIENYRGLQQFGSWVEFLTAARCGNRLAKAALISTPEHPAVTFPLTSVDIKTYLSYARHTIFSQAWIDHLLSLLRATETFDEIVTVTSPLGQKHTIPLTASVGLLNQVLGYEGVPEHIRAQLELRRWILIHTRVDGAEQPQILTSFRMAATA